VKWARAVHHLEELAASCARMAAGPELLGWRVVELWAARELLEPPKDLDTISVARVVTAPVHDVPWLSAPQGAEAWAFSTRLIKNPIVPLWRSVESPVWNHWIERPALVWSERDGTADDVLAAIRDGRGETVRTPPPEPEALRARLADELDVSLRTLRSRAKGYDEIRWSPRKLEPAADALWQAADGYLDVLDAVRRL
jgi:hypothetical protein